MIRAYIRNSFSIKNKKKIHNLLQDIKAIGRGRNLNQLAKIYGTDKNVTGGHFYTPHYSHHLKRYRYKKIKMLEIGIGGYDNPYLGGNSLRMWKKYFPFGKIYGLDIFDKFFHQEKRVKIFQGSQVDKVFLERVTNEIGAIDVIIDDGSHVNEHVIESFNFLFPKLKDGGIYIIEDVQTSYWESFGGDSHNLDNKNTMMGYFKSLTDKLNKEELINSNYVRDYFDEKIISIHFYYNMIFIYKGNNNEKSNTIVNNQLPKR
jgi:hypothetical protein